MSEHTTALMSLLETATAIAVANHHGELDPGHVLIAAIDRGYPLSPELLEAVHLDRQAILADLDRRLAGPGQPSPTLQESKAMEHARSVAETSSRDRPVTPEALLLAVWNVPGATVRFTHRGRWLATAELRMALGIDTRSDRLRVSVRRRRLATAESVARLTKTRLGRPIAAMVKGAAKVLGWITHVFGAFVNYGALFLLWPGLVTREGARVVTARALGSRRRSPEFLRSLGSEYYLDPVPSPGRTGAILLVPHVVTFLAGVVLILQALVDARTLGSNPLPAFTSRGAEVISADETELVADFVTQSPMAVWFAIACLFVALPPYATVRQARSELAASGRVGRLAGIAVVPLALVTACLAPIEWLVSKAGLNAIFGVGLVTLFAGAWVAAAIVDGVIL